MLQKILLRNLQDFLRKLLQGFLQENQYMDCSKGIRNFRKISTSVPLKIVLFQGFLQEFLCRFPRVSLQRILLEFLQGFSQRMKRFFRWNPFKIMWENPLSNGYIIVLELSLGEFLEETLDESLEEFMKICGIPDLPRLKQMRVGQFTTQI